MSKEKTYWAVYSGCEQLVHHRYTYRQARYIMAWVKRNTEHDGLNLRKVNAEGKEVDA